MSGKLLTTLLRRPPSRKRILEPAIDIERAPNWEGELDGSFGAPEGATIRIKAHIGFDYQMIEGEGRAVNLPAKGYADGFALSGVLTESAVALQIWFNGEPFGRQPFLCTGDLSEDGRAMAGDWSVACQNPDSCNCQGGGGTFRLKRVG
jgi:hypothetical protein